VDIGCRAEGTDIGWGRGVLTAHTRKVGEIGDCFKSASANVYTYRASGAGGEYKFKLTYGR
jgi:hypothetical protein